MGEEPNKKRVSSAWVNVLLMLVGLFALKYAVEVLLPQKKRGRRDGLAFERELKEVFERQGYKVSLTDHYDWGADLILEKDGVRTLVQAKDHFEPVGQSAVQAVVAAMPVYKGHKAMVVARGAFTPRAKSLAKANQVELWSREGLEKRKRAS